jgi:integrase
VRRVGGTQRRERAEGTIRRRGDAWQVSLFTGYDPLNGRRLYLRETVHSEVAARKALNKLRAQRDEQQAPKVRVELSYALREWLATQELAAATRASYETYIRVHIEPALGGLAIARLSPQVLERFYAELRRCRDRCRPGDQLVDHRVAGAHECTVVVHRRPPGRLAAGVVHDCSAAGCETKTCPPHECRPLANATIVKAHFIISGALTAAARWGWIASNPAAAARRPRIPAPRPTPPTADQAARIIAAAWEADEEWGTLVWLAMVTGLRRAELLGLRWADVDLTTGTLTVSRNVVVVGGRLIEKDTKTHRMRRIALDSETVEVLIEHRERWYEQARTLELAPTEDAYLFSYDPANARPCDPSGVTHRYARMCAAVGIDSHLHALRHYSATELLMAGVDLRTVAGRLGHGGGGTTTLRVYAAWVGESDRRAAEILGSRMTRPVRHPA